MKRVAEIQKALIRFLYWACRVAAFPLLVFYFVYRVAREPRYLHRILERLGDGPASFLATPPGAIWLHAVSVGEVLTAAGLLRELRERSPGIPLYVSVGTLAGRAVADEKLAQLADGVFFAPIDYGFAVRRWLRRIRPAVVVIMETEIWPLLYREVKQAGCALVIVNGRISDRAFPRYRRWRFFFRHALQCADAIFTQSEQDSRRYLALGADQDRVRSLGNLKYDVAPMRGQAPMLIRELVSRLRPETIWIAASTMPPATTDDVDEDQVVVDAFRELAPRHPGLLLILVPRKPARFDAAEQRLRAARIPYLRRSHDTIDAHLALPCVVLLDSIGELASLFPLADVVFMGGSLARRGGHNLLEPAACARAIVSGPHLENFAAIADEFRAHGAMHEIAGPGELAGAIDLLIGDAALRGRLGARAAELAIQHRGATGKIAAEILKWQDRVAPSGMPRGFWTPLLWALSKLWIGGSGLKQRRDVARVRHLNTPVISIGAISMGGAGKTPMVDYLAERLSTRGHNPAILTRGYRRRSVETSIVIDAGAPVPVSVTGDEAQIYVHSGYAQTGIGADRWTTGRLLEEKYQPDVFLLDDGFQHRRLARDLDIVLIDALNPLAGGAVFPLGRQREPLRGLSRASAFIIMRAAPERDYAGLRELLRRYNPHAPVFRARTEPRYWVSHRTKRLAHPPEGPVAAFCGLGNPCSFWLTLQELRIRPVFTWSFSDHHRYSWSELHGLASQARMHGANVLLCTEKDALNMPERSMELLLNDSVELFWLKIGLEIEEEDALIELIESKLRR